ncbi:MAG: hypothetical protein ACUVXJ_05430, partial [Phycisphaerae bacterium]
LRSVPETWAEYDPAMMTEPSERALSLLVAAGMVERRSTFHLRMFGHPVAVEATITVTGEYGGVEALERVAAGVWEEWGQAWQARKDGPTKDAPAFHCERIGREQWRLTADGIQARGNLETEAAVVFDFVLKRGFFDGRPRVMPDGRISQRLPVRGKGALEKMELVKADAPGAGPAGVSIANWADGGKAFADAFAAAFASIQAKGNPPAIANAPTSTKPAAPDATAETEDAGDVGGPTEDPHDNRVAWWAGKRIYLGNDTEVSRLFWLLAKPVGAAANLAQVQRAIDGMETPRDRRPDDVRKAAQRLRKVVSKLRAALREAGLDDHVLIVKDGPKTAPQYSMVPRFGK